VDFRHFELSDLLAEALIAVEAGDRARAEAALRRALRWVEADWLATPSDAPACAAPAGPSHDEDDED
jgi:DNA-binding GntR family transcriptional regulator